MPMAKTLVRIRTFGRCGLRFKYRQQDNLPAGYRLHRQACFLPRAQTALNYVIFAEQLPVNFLPAYCNWMPGDAPPAFDAGRGVFVEPYAPHEVIGVMHLAGAEQKTHVFRLNRLDGGAVETSLRYSATRELCGARLELSA